MIHVEFFELLTFYLKVRKYPNLSAPLRITRICLNNLLNQKFFDQLTFGLNDVLVGRDKLDWRRQLTCSVRISGLDDQLVRHARNELVNVDGCLGSVNLFGKSEINDRNVCIVTALITNSNSLRRF